MKKDEIKVGHAYEAKVSDRVVTVRIDSTNTHGGWNATNTATGKRIHIKSAQRLRRAVRESRRREATADVAEQSTAAAAAEAAVVNPTVEVVTGQPVPRRWRRRAGPCAREETHAQSRRRAEAASGLAAGCCLRGPQDQSRADALQGHGGGRGGRGPVDEPQREDAGGHPV